MFKEDENITQGYLLQYECFIVGVKTKILGDVAQYIKVDPFGFHPS